MSRAAKLAPPLSALTSAALHVALLAAGVAASAHPETERARLAPDAWAARSVEVGTVPDAMALQPVPEHTPEEPRPPSPSRVDAAPAFPAPKPSASAASRAPRLAAAAPSHEGVSAEPPPVRKPARAARVDSPPNPSNRDKVARTASGQPAAALAAAPAPSAAAATSDAAGSLGNVGLPAGVRHLATAFTRALPAGGYRDAAWTELPLGKVGTASIALSVSDSGTLEEVAIEPAQSLSPVLGRMIDRAVLLLKSGTFSLDPRKVSGGGTEHLELEVTLSTRPANGDELAAPGGLFAQSFAPPQPDRPGYARFTLNSGRHIEAVVRFAKDHARIR
jgi:hypothetical protein